MPIFGLQTSMQRDANAAMAAAFFPRQNDLIYPKLCGHVTSTRPVEPFSILGGVPLLRQFRGTISRSSFGSFKLQVPNQLFSRIIDVARSDWEYDQTGTLVKSMGGIGQILLNTPDYALARKLLTGHTAASTSEVGEDGASYYSTFEQGVPFYSAAHTMLPGTNQSNIVSGGLPATIAGLASNPADSAIIMQSDFRLIVSRIMGLKNDKGALLFPSFNPKESLVLVVPPCLSDIAKLAFQTPGGLVGGAAGSTTNYMRIKDVVTMAQLAGCDDVTSENDGATLSPTNETDYHWVITDDIVRAFYLQTYRPKTASEIPGYSNTSVNYSPDGAARELVSKNVATPAAADLYASTMIDHNLGAIGSNAQASTVEKQQFFMAPRMRFNFVYGPWFTSGKVIPSGATS